MSCFMKEVLVRNTELLSHPQLEESVGEGDDWGWDGWMASPTQWTWVWVSSKSWWWTGKPGMLQSMGSPRVGHDWATELNWTDGIHLTFKDLSNCFQKWLYYFMLHHQHGSCICSTFFNTWHCHLFFFIVAVLPVKHSYTSQHSSLCWEALSQVQWR